MRKKAKDLNLGDKIKIGGFVCKIQGIQENNRGKIVLNLFFLGMPRPTAYGRKAYNTRQLASVILTISRKKKLKLLK